MGDNRVPQVATRRAESTIKVKDGQTVVIGGLIETKLIKSLFKIPLLGDLPLVGKAFRTKSNSNTKTNLIILLTVHILNDKDNTLSKNALREINNINIKNLKDSETLKELSMPLIVRPGVYGEESEDDLQNESKASEKEVDYENTEEVLDHLNTRLEQIKNNHK
jgi:hypothetical protein